LVAVAEAVLLGRSVTLYWRHEHPAGSIVWSATLAALLMPLIGFGGCLVMLQNFN
jgi:hypothetical protein